MKRYTDEADEAAKRAAVAAVAKWFEIGFELRRPLAAAAAEATLTAGGMRIVRARESIVTVDLRG
jgi:hypothetical protein